MTYVGQQPSTTFDSGIQDRFTGLSSNTVTLTHDISAETDILVVWNNIVQDSGTYSVGGTGNKTLTLGGTLVSADVVTVYYTNKVMQSINPTAGSVTTATINDTAVTGAKLNTDVISAQTALGATPADTDELLVSDAGVLKRVDYSHLKGSNNLPAFSAVMNASVTNIASATWTTIVYNRELFDTGSLFDTSNGTFICDSTNAGKWLFCYTAQDAYGGTGVSDQRYFTFNRYDAGSGEWTRIQNSHELTGDYHEQIGASQTVLLDMQNGDKMLVQYYHNSGSANGHLYGASDWSGNVYNIFGGMRLSQ